MSEKNNKNVAAQALLEMDAITSAIKEESKKSLSSLLSEAVKDAIREECDEDDDKDKDYEVVDGENENDAAEIEDDSKAPSDSDEDADVEKADDAEAAEEAAEEEEPTDGAEDVPAEDSEEDGDDEWDSYSKYQVGDNTYDLTGEKDYDNVVKVYKLLKDDDQVVVRKDGDKVQIKDAENGTEYVIDLGSDDAEDASEDSVDSEEISQDELNESEIAGFDDSDEEEPMEFEVTPDEEEPMDSEDNSDINARIQEIQQELDNLRASNNLQENKKQMKESKEVLFEVDLGYTDNYQDKDPIDGLSNNEPSKSGKSWHKGVPTGTEKPWAGETKTKGDPFKETQTVEGSVNEEEEPVIDEEPVEEATNVGGAVQQRTTSKSHIPAGRKNYGPFVKRHVSTEANYDEIVSENKNLKSTNKELKEAVMAIRKNLQEAYVTNANLAKITKLFLECTTSKAEKIDIVNRFSNEAKTVEQSKALYESIRKDLNKTNANQMNITESNMSVNNTKQINETKVYKTNDLMKTIDLMNRVLGC